MVIPFYHRFSAMLYVFEYDIYLFSPLQSAMLRVAVSYLADYFRSTLVFLYRRSLQWGFG